MIQPRVTRILEAWKSPKVLHICGATDMLIEMMAECGADALSVDIKNNLVESRKKIGNDALLVGNFDVFALPCKEETTEHLSMQEVFRSPNEAADHLIRPEIDRFHQSRGRRPRLLITWSTGGEGIRTNEVAAEFARYGFDVDISPDHVTLLQIARMAIDNDVHVICLLSDANAARELTAALKEYTCENIRVVIIVRGRAENGSEDLPSDRMNPIRIDPWMVSDVLLLLKELMTRRTST